MKVLVLGGYGLFGAHISRKLAEDGGFEVIVAGRNVASAAQLIASLPVAPQPPEQDATLGRSVDTYA